MAPANVLLRSISEPSSAALADFDTCSAPPGGDGDALHRTFFGPRGPPRAGVSGTPVGVFAAGCIASELACGQTPFGDAGGLAELYRRIDAGGWRFPDDAAVPEALRELIVGMLDADAARRAKAGEALRHPFFLGPDRVPAAPRRRRSPSGARVHYDEATGALLLAQGSRCEERAAEGERFGAAQRGRQVWA
ncbi:hypothetical protein DFJ74DRAFT_769600 [Hyaloraphidium curvatum]|nr:hypothetical protein DFJ74DRAFT_769600 [Hyaloraphidium curvatum]